MKLNDATPTRSGAMTLLRHSLVGLGLLSLAATAPAANITGGAFIDWSTLNIEVVKGDATFEISGQRTFLYHDDFNVFEYESSEDWTTSLLKNSDNGATQSVLSADSNSIFVGATMDDSGFGQFLSLSASRYANLNITGSGTLLVSVAGTVGGDISASDPSTTYAAASGSIRLGLSAGPLYNSSSLDSYVEWSDYYPSSDLQSRVLTVAFNVTDGEQLFLDISAYSELNAGHFNTVPVPAALPLLGSALLGLTGIKRTGKRRAQQDESANT